MKSGYWIGIALIVLGLGGFAAGHYPRPETQNEKPDYGTVPDFALTESSGKPVSLQDLRGRVWIADFIFTHCAGTCPLLSAEMQKLRSDLSESIAMVSFSVDPDHDTAEVLTQYAKQYRHDGQNWMFLTGARPAVKSLIVTGFKMALDDTQGTEQEPIVHSTRFVLVDKQGRIQGYYGSSDEDDLKRLAEDARKLL